MSERKHETCIRRLNHLRKVVWNVPDDKFDMLVWKKSTTCGTKACAGGHAASDPDFNAEGLHILIDFHGALFPAYGDYKGYEALEEFFLLDSREVAYIFDPVSYDNVNSTDNVISHIEMVLYYHEKYDERD